jgi:hypothetical protein
VGCKKVAEQYTEMEMVFYTYLVMVILLAPLVWYYEPEMFSVIPDYTARTWTGMIALTFSQLPVDALFFKVLRYLDATQVALVQLPHYVHGVAYRGFCFG